MAETPWEMAEVGSEFSHQTALFAWAAMARSFGALIANEADSYRIPGLAKRLAEGPSPWDSPPIPELKWLHAIKNAEKGGKARGSMSVAEGVRSGVFDVFLPVPKLWNNVLEFDGGFGHSGGYSGYAGLYIELKTPDRLGQKNGGASDTQMTFQADMRAAGYAAEVCHGWEAARECLLTYLGKSGAQ